MRRFIALAGLAIIACLHFTDGTAAQQAYPSRTVKFIIPFGAASASDITARLFADRLSARWGKPVVVENRPGGDGIVSVEAFVSAADDSWARDRRSRPAGLPTTSSQLRVLLAGLLHKPHRSLPQLLRILPRCWHNNHPLVASDQSPDRGRFTPVILLIHNLDVRIIDAATGELLRELTIDPDRDYQPTGKDRYARWRK
jgi:hypothetical protein